MENAIQKKPSYELTPEAEGLRRSMKREHLVFVDAYLSGMPPAEAYALAGLGAADDAVSQRMAARLLQMPKIRMYIDELSRSVSVRSAMTLEAIDQSLADIATSSIMDVVQAAMVTDPETGGKRSIMLIKNTEDLTPAQKASIASIKPMGALGFEIKLHDKLKALEMLIKRRGGFSETVNQTVNGGITIFANVGNNGRGPSNQ